MNKSYSFTQKIKKLILMLLCFLFYFSYFFVGSVFANRALAGSFVETSCSALFTENKKPVGEQVLVIGSGSFGLSFSQAISGNFKTVTVFGRNKKIARQILDGLPADPLPGVKLSSNIKPTLKLMPFLGQAFPEIVVLALPVSQIPLFAKTHFQFFSSMIRKHPDMVVVSLSKGFYFKDGKIWFIQDLLLDSWPGFTLENFYLISGPSFALDLAQGEKTLVSLAGHNITKTQKIKKLLSTATFDMALSEDMKGIAFAGAIKNVMAIVGGIGKGLNLSHNSRTALIMRGTEELIQIGQELGARPQSFLGPAYLGDLILSLEKESRNSRLGFVLGRGQSLHTFLTQNPNINIEGLHTINSLKSYLKDREGFPYFNSLYKIIYENQDPKSLVL